MPPPERSMSGSRLKHPNELLGPGELTHTKTRALIMLHQPRLGSSRSGEITERKPQIPRTSATNCGHSKTSPRPSVSKYEELIPSNSSSAVVVPRPCSVRHHPLLPQGCRSSNVFSQHCQQSVSLETMEPANSVLNQMSDRCASISLRVGIRWMAAFDLATLVRSVSD